MEYITLYVTKDQEAANARLNYCKAYCGGETPAYPTTPYENQSVHSVGCTYNAWVFDWVIVI